MNQNVPECSLHHPLKLCIFSVNRKTKMADIAKHWTIYLIDQNQNLQQFFSYIMVVSFFMKETRENQQPAARN